VFRLIVAEYAFWFRNIVGRLGGRQGAEGDSALAGKITIKPNCEAHGDPLWWMCRSQKARRRGEYPGNRAIQSGYIYILRLAGWIAITRMATTQGAIRQMGHTGYGRPRWCVYNEYVSQIARMSPRR